MGAPPAEENETVVEDRGTIRNPPDVSRFRHRIDELVSKTDHLEQKVEEVALFYATKKPTSNWKGHSVVSKDNARKHADGGRRRGACTSRMDELMQEFMKILNQIASLDWSWPFMDPVDVKALHLDDYYEVIKKPMDINTILSQMKAGGYKHVREIYADARLVFTNAMTYNTDERHDVHVMAKSLLSKLEAKWLKLLPDVITEEEKKQKEEAALALANTKISQESAIARKARDINNELNELNMHLNELREMVAEKCRKFSVYEKRKLGAELSLLSPEDLDKALEIIAEDNPSFQASSNAAEIDMDAQSQTTLWKLKFFVKRALEPQPKNNITSITAENLKRKNEIRNVVAMAAAKKRSRKQLS